MSKVFAVYTSDPNLMRCELARLRDLVPLKDAPASNAVGIGSYAQEDVLLRRFSRDLTLAELAEGSGGPESEAVLYHSGVLPVGVSLDDNTQPFRFRRWLFAHHGTLHGFEHLRTRLLSSLPEFLQRQIRGDLPSEAAFALFLKLLRESGRTGEVEIDVAAQALGKAVRELEQHAAEAGAVGRSTLNFVATNQRMMLAARHGPEPLYYRLLEGEGFCERCGLPPHAPDSHPLVREHRRRRTVVVTSVIGKGNGWLELEQGGVLAIDRGLKFEVLRA